MDTLFKTCTDLKAGNFVKSFWQFTGRPAYEKEIILPKGVVEFIFSFDEAPVYSYNNKTPTQSTPRCFVNGMNDSSLELKSPGKQSFFGITMHPHTIKKLLRIPSGSFLNQVIDLESINKEFTGLWHHVAEAEKFDTRIQLIHEWINSRCSEVDDREQAVCDFLTGSSESVSVKTLASKFCYSSRQLQRKSKEIFGMSTENLIGYRRYLHALTCLHHSNETLTRIAYECNYYDQAHFNRDFKAYTGLTPGKYRESKKMIAGHLYQ